MGAKKMANTFEKVIKNGGDVFNASEELQDEILDQRNDIVRFCEVAKVALLASIGEKELVRFMSMIQKTAVVELTMNGDVSIIAADFEGALQPYTHTVILAAIGALIEDEIL